MIGTVLVIDDHMIERMQLRRALARSRVAGTILEFAYAEDALAHLSDPATSPPDLILLDVHMPRMDGPEFLAAVQARLGPGFARAVVVLQTIDLEPAQRTRVLACPAVKRILDKPLSPQDVRDLAGMLEGAPAA